MEYSDSPPRKDFVPDEPKILSPPKLLKSSKQKLVDNEVSESQSLNVARKIIKDNYE